LGSPDSAWISSAAVGVVEGGAAGLARGASVVGEGSDSSTPGRLPGGCRGEAADRLYGHVVLAFGKGGCASRQSTSLVRAIIAQRFDNRH
jgi:hypothetical protein